MLNRGRLLLGAFDDCERAVAFASRVASVDAADVRRRWSEARRHFLVSAAPLPAQPLPIDERTRAAIAEILATPLFRSALDGRPWSLASVDSAAVATLQPVVNLGRVTVMRERIAASGIIPILFPSTTELDVEQETGAGPTVSFLSSRGELAVSGAQIHRATDTAPIELTFRIEPRPNYVSVLSASAAFVLRNGHHRLIAACAEGARTVPMVIVEGSLEALATKIDGLPSAAVAGKRAATLADFLDPSPASLDVELRPKRYALRLRVEHETLYAA